MKNEQIKEEKPDRQFSQNKVNTPKDRQSESKLLIMLLINVFQKMLMKVKKTQIILVQFRVCFFPEMYLKTLMQMCLLLFT